MAISTSLIGASQYDYDRQMMYGQQHQELLRQQEAMRQQEFYRRQGGFNTIDNGGTGRSIAANPVEFVDPKDPLAFLKKADKTVLLTGEA